MHLVPGSPRGCVAYAGVALALGARFTTCASLCRSRSGACPTWVRGGNRGFARPLGSLHRLPTLCRPFHGLIPRVMLGCRGCAPPEGVASPPAYSMSPVSRAKIVFMPVVARRRGYIENFFFV